MSAESSLARLRRRGPDDEGLLFLDTGSGQRLPVRTEQTHPALGGAPLAEAIGGGFDLVLGQTRLSVLDPLPRGHQPMSTPDGRYHIAYNGEVYNWVKLRQELRSIGHLFTTGTDTEVVLHAYQEWGPDCLRRFNGMWAFALWDAEDRELFLARDRFGVKPLVYHLGPTCFICASTADSVVEHPAVSRDIDPYALHDFLSLGAVPWPETIYGSVRKLPPGMFMVVSSRGVTAKRYWDLAANLREEVTCPGDAQARLEELVEDAVRIRMVADVPVGTFLSGGLDSSLVSALAARSAAPMPIRTFSIGFLGFGDSDESAWARRAAQAMAAEHVVMELEESFVDLLAEFAGVVDEPFASPSVLGLYLLSRFASTQITVVLSGDGGDEVFAGYVPRQMGVDAHWDAFRRRPLGWLRSGWAVDGWPELRWEQEGLAGRLRRRMCWERMSDGDVRDRDYLRSILHAATHGEKLSLYSPEWAERVRGRRTEDFYLAAMAPRGSTDNLTRWQLFDIQTTLVDEMLTKVDRATMAWGLEARTPLLDYRVVEAALAMPSARRVWDGHGKMALRELAAKHLPADIIDRPKQGFTVPLGDWMGGSYGVLVREVMEGPELQQTGIFDRSALTRVVAPDNGAMPKCEPTLVFNIVSLALWLRQHDVHVS